GSALVQEQSRRAARSDLPASGGRRAHEPPWLRARCPLPRAHLHRRCRGGHGSPNRSADGVARARLWIRPHLAQLLQPARRGPAMTVPTRDVEAPATWDPVPGDAPFIKIDRYHPSDRPDTEAWVRARVYLYGNIC